MNVLRNTPTLIIIGLTALACSDSVENPEHAFHIIEQGNLTIAETTGGPKYDQELFRYELVYTCQEDERPASYLAGGQGGLIDQNLFIYFPDGPPMGDHHIAVFDSTGRYHSTLGRSGEGPGEYENPTINSIVEGVVEIYDGPQGRLIQFQADGTLIKSVRMPWSVSLYRIRGLYSIPQVGYLHTRLADPRYKTSNGDVLHATMYTTDWDTLWTKATEPILANRTPFYPKPQIVYHNQLGVIFTTGNEPILDVYDASGTHQLRIDLGLPPESVTQVDRRRYEEPFKESIQSGTGRQREQTQQSLRELQYPEVKAFWGEVFLFGIKVDDSGYIWIRVPAWADECGDRALGTKYRICSPEGEYLGMTTLPGIGPGRSRVSKGHLTVNDRDPETGARIVALYRIESAILNVHYPN